MIEIRYLKFHVADVFELDENDEVEKKINEFSNMELMMHLYDAWLRYRD